MTTIPPMIPKSYEPKEVDPKWYSFWIENNYFKTDYSSNKTPFSMVMPPPNVTGTLHMGHALVSTLSDILIRFKRMKGFEVLWIPGTDHAGIATQTVVERNLLQKTGKRRVDFDREEFLSKIWEWKQDKESLIHEQIRKVGCSCDWDTLSFTLDDEINQSVLILFKKLFDDNLIYQGDYLVNWDTITETALADDEVEYEERKGNLWYFSYPLEDQSESLVIATTRPETMLGDTAVCVNPKDERFQHLIGKNILLPIQNRLIPIIADHHVDITFGTGALKITPAHDPNDYQIAQSHNLEMINIMTPDGKINEVGGKFEGLTMDAARSAVVDKMKSLGLLEKIEPHTNRVGTSYRSKAVIEPYLSKQWYIKMEPFKEKLKSAVDEGRVELIPPHWKNLYHHWIDNLRDWCVSRQLWWGHRIPIWHNIKDPTIKKCVIDGSVLDPNEWEQDPDVLDTWFSSALWPFSTLGWPNTSNKLDRFYPNATLITGYDILFFWVARMIMMGEYAIGEVPFKKAFLHGLIFGKSYWRTDENGAIEYCSSEERNRYDKGETPPKDVSSRWEKMSKSKGNVLDPMEVINEYGTDAMRMALAACPSSSRQIDLDHRKLEEFRNFTNKVWNGARFVLMSLEDLTSETFNEPLKPESFALEDHWILETLNRAIKEVTDHIENYQFDHAATKAYEFFWNDFCAYYVEICKPVLYKKGGNPKTYYEKQKILFSVLEQSLRLLHPFAPFITEELFQLLKTTFTFETIKDPSITIAPYPEYQQNITDSASKSFIKMKNLLYTIRNLRGEMKIPPSTTISLTLIAEKENPTIKENLAILKSLSRIDSITWTDKETDHFNASIAQVDDLKVIIPLPKELLAQEKVRIKKELEKHEKTIEKITLQLQNPAFTERAPEQLIQKQKQILEQALENQKLLST
ncbi:valine--tRNA ligase, partial [Chlamydiales bacterium]|nr:valine--tRNA ligase [Chlamydiales bacterium]